MGSAIGYPTANLKLTKNIDDLIDGVYVSRMTISDGQAIRLYHGVTSVGIPSTVGGKIRTIETFLLDYRGGELYGKKADLELLEYIRGMKTFANWQQLKQAIAADVTLAKNVHRHHKTNRRDS